MTQQQRVLAALRQRGQHGLTQVDFLLPSVIDGGKPITRVGARILELRQDGHRIVSDGWRDQCSVYVLEEQAGVSDGPACLGGQHGHAAVGTTTTAGPSETTSLFDPDSLSKPAGAYDDRWEDAA